MHRRAQTKTTAGTNPRPERSGKAVGNDRSQMLKVMDGKSSAWVQGTCSGSVKMHRNASVALMLSRRSKLALPAFPLQGHETHRGHSAISREGSKITPLGSAESDKASTGPGSSRATQRLNDYFHLISFWQQKVEADS